MKILLILATVIVIFVIVVALQPGTFSVTRSATIAAPAPIVFAQVNDLKRWESWSPWAKLDPNMKVTFSGAESGVGASYYWVGDKKVGEGKMTILESRPNEFIKLKLEFIKPFASTNTTDFTFKQDAGQTHVTWTMYGPKNFMSKAMGLFMNLDKLIGTDFEKGLAALKTNSEPGAVK